MPQHMTPLSPEARHGLPNRRIIFLRVRIHISCVRDFGKRGRSDEVDLGMRKRF